MPEQEIYHLHPVGWENDSDEEKFDISTLDYLTVQSYNNYAIFFKLDDTDKPKAIKLLKAGLEKTLSQERHMACKIEKQPNGGHAFVKKRDSTVQFIIQWLDAPEDNYPSIDDIERANFSAITLGDLKLWSVPPMTYGEKPEAHPDNNPVVAAYKVNLVRGGLVFNMHHHHYSQDVMGWTGLTHQLAENCLAISEGTNFPPWDPTCLDVSHLVKQAPPENELVDGPPIPERHPDQMAGVSLLFHLPKSKAAELKKLAKPTDGSWISTYDAFSAYIWRSLTRLRTPIFKPDLAGKPFWSEAVDMRRRCFRPKPPARIRGNVMSAVMSEAAPIEPPSVAQVISEWPLSQLASYIRRLTDSVTEETLHTMLDTVARVRDKSTLNIRIDSKPPMSLLQTDHRDANIVQADFGFGSPIGYRHVLDCVTVGVIVIYPSRNPSPESDEGPEFAIFYEKDLAQTLIEDAEFAKYFEYRGVDAENAEPR